MIDRGDWWDMCNLVEEGEVFDDIGVLLVEYSSGGSGGVWWYG